MTTNHSTTTTVMRRSPAGRVSLVLALGIVCMLACHKVKADELYPVALMNWMVERSFHALIVDKSRQQLTVWEVDGGRPRLVESFACSTGENRGDKWVRGDMKTPEGVYFFCSVIDGRRLPPKYGLWAFTTDYPNFVDRRRGKSGDGIWLHGRDKPLGPKPDSNGCIALENDDLIRVSRYIRLQSTPLIVVKHMRMRPKSEIIEEERRVRDFIESWRQAWESRDIDRYMKHYSLNFQSCWLDYWHWKEKKRRLIKRYSEIQVNLGNVYIYRQNGLITAIFTQAYRSDSYRATGIKILYVKDEGEYRVYAEDYHQPVDDPYPVRVLLARVGSEPLPETEEVADFRIRLVSTDELEVRSEENVERPMPVAPSRGVELERIAGKAAAHGPVAPRFQLSRKVEDQRDRRQVLAATVLPDDFEGIERSPRPEPVRTHEPAEFDAADTVEVRTRKPEADARPAPQRTAALPADPQDPPHKTSAPADVSPEDIETRTERGCAQPVEERVRAFLRNWETAWEQKDLDRYLKMYHRAFQAGETDYEEFCQSKRRYFRKYDSIRVKVDRLQIRKVDGHFRVKFVQTFQGDDYRDKGWKTMVLADGEDEGLKIIRERWSRL